MEKSKKFLNQVEDYYEKYGVLNGEISQIKINFDNESDFKLSDLGAEEMETIGKRYQERFPEIFSFNSVLNQQESAKELIRIISSSKERSIQSAIHFIEGIYDFNDSGYYFKDIVKYLTENIEINDRLMRMYSECNNYLNMVKNNESASSELSKFKYGKEVTNLLFNFKQRNLIPDFELSPSKLFEYMIFWI